jgi:hypothetical protein
VVQINLKCRVLDLAYIKRSFFRTNQGKFNNVMQLPEDRERIELLFLLDKCIFMQKCLFFSQKFRLHFYTIKDRDKGSKCRFLDFFSG